MNAITKKQLLHALRAYVLYTVKSSVRYKKIN